MLAMVIPDAVLTSIRETGETEDNNIFVLFTPGAVVVALNSSLVNHKLAAFQLAGNSNENNVSLLLTNWEDC